MLPKKNRADRRAVEQIFKTGRFINSPSLTFKFIKNTTNIPRLSFLTPKSIFKSAVKRNLLRRGGYAALEKYLDRFPANISAVFIYKKYQDNISTIEDEIEKILNQLN